MSKQVIDRKAATELVASAAETHAERLTEGFRQAVERYVRPDEKAKVPDLGYAMVLIARALRDKNEKLIEADARHEMELADDAAPRDARDGATEALVEEIVSLRSAVQAAYGSEGLRLLGLEGSTPTEPRAMVLHARKLLDRLKDKKLSLPKPKKKGVLVDPAAWTHDIHHHLEILEQALKDVAREVREAQATGDAKVRAMVDNDALFGKGATLISASLRFIGEAQLASKVRPSARRPGTVIVDADEEEESNAADEKRPASGQEP